MSKLYKVTIKLMVVAKNVDDARHVSDDVDQYLCDFQAKEITKISECLPRWEDAIPFGDQGSDDFTCAEIINSFGG